MSTPLKTIVVSLLAAWAVSAHASEVEIYGSADMGLSYTRMLLKTPGEPRVVTKSVSLDSGNTTPSKWGIKAQETIGTLKVKLLLEGNYSGDTGEQTFEQIFNRESSLGVEGNFGTVYMGRLYSLYADGGSVGFWGLTVSPFASGCGFIAGHEAVLTVKVACDNSIAYVSPTLGPVTLYAQYGSGDNGHENKTGTDRYYAAGASANLGGLQLVTVMDYMNRQSSNEGGSIAHVKDAWTGGLGGSYALGNVTLYAAGQYFKDTARLYAMIGVPQQPEILGFTGYGVNVGILTGFAGGSVALSAGHADGKAYEGSEKLGSFNLNSVLLGYGYPLSKRSSVYLVGGHTRRVLKTGEGKSTNSVTQVMSGFAHIF